MLMRDGFLRRGGGPRANRSSRVTGRLDAIVAHFGEIAGVGGHGGQQAPRIAC
jgi:hypothetical protein